MSLIGELGAAVSDLRIRRRRSYLELEDYMQLSRIEQFDKVVTHWSSLFTVHHRRRIYTEEKAKVVAFV